MTTSIVILQQKAEKISEGVIIIPVIFQKGVEVCEKKKNISQIFP